MSDVRCCGDLDFSDAGTAAAKNTFDISLLHKYQNVFRRISLCDFFDSIPLPCLSDMSLVHYMLELPTKSNTVTTTAGHQHGLTMMLLFTVTDAMYFVGIMLLKVFSWLGLVTCHQYCYW